MYFGLDLSLLNTLLRKQVLSSAASGAGVYDFLACEKTVPNKAICVVSFSEAAFFRNPLSDKNRTGLELSCLLDLYHCGCSMDECWRIIELNKKSINYTAFGFNYHLFPYADSLCYPEPLYLWLPLFEEQKEWFLWKAKAYEFGLQHLDDKQIQIILVQFPFDEQVESFAKNSINCHLSDSLKRVLIDEYTLKYDSIVLHSDSLLMHDLSHMNEVGARLFTLEIAEILRSDTVNNYFIEVKIR